MTGDTWVKRRQALFTRRVATIVEEEFKSRWRFVEDSALT